MSARRKDSSKSNPPLDRRNQTTNVDPGASISQALPVILDYYSALSMVLGGCCTNVWAYEQLLMLNSSIGSALTFSQMLFITVQSLPEFLILLPGHWLPRLKARQVPLHQWLLQVLVLTTGSLLNNWAFAYQVPLTLLIVFRSAGLAVSMMFGMLFLKKRYTLAQILSVAIVSGGVVLATLSCPKPAKTFSSEYSVQSSEDMRRYMIGICMLVVSLFMTASLGLLQERTYIKYGPCWKESIFYTHFLSLPVFLFLISDIKQGISSLSNNPSTSSALIPYLALGMNLVSQLICVSGVNKLSSVSEQVSSVSTNLVLTARKALSLCISVWWFNSGWNVQLGIGAGMVFVGSIVFSMAGNSKSKRD